MEEKIMARRVYFSGGCQHCGSIVIYTYDLHVEGRQIYSCPMCGWTHSRDISELQQHTAITPEMKMKPKNLR